MPAPASLAYLEVRLSGGAGNTDPGASLGGVMSSTRVRHQTVTGGPSNITGVVVDDAAGNPGGAGTLSFTAATKALSWAAFGESAAAAASPTEDGRYALRSSGGGYLFVTVTFSSLPGTDQSDALQVANAANEVFDDIAKTESYDGDTEYRCLYSVWTHPTEDALGVKHWIGLQPVGADSWEIGLDPAGIGDGAATGVAATVADENTPPAGVAFSAPAGTGDALLSGNHAPGSAHALWIKRTVPANTTVATPANHGRLNTQINV